MKLRQPKNARGLARRLRENPRRRPHCVETLEARCVLDSTVVLNEVMYNPALGDQTLEWIELYNENAVDMDISAWELTGGVNFKFAEGTILGGGKYLVVAANPGALAATGYGTALGPYSGLLDNGGEKIELHDRGDRVMDELDYRDSGGWPVAPDGSGASLAKRDLDLPSGELSSWASSVVVGGTPGRRNFPAPNSTRRSETLVSLDAAWRFEATGTDLGTNWRTTNYNDSTWAGGNAATLLAYLPLDGNATATVGTSGSLVGGPTATTDRNGAAGGALAFNGNLQQRVEIAGGAPLNGASEGTISMWVKWTGIQDAACCGGSFGNVLGRQGNGLFSNNIIGLSTSDPATAKLTWQPYNAGGPVITGTTAVGNNAWHHIAVTFRTGEQKVYLDGVLQGTAATTGTLSSDSSVPLTIGAWTGDGAGFATGSIDDVAIWNQVLPGSQISQLATKTSVPLDFAGPKSAVYYAGTGQVASGDDPRKTQVPLGPNTYYFRKQFNFDDDPGLTSLTFNALVDDGAVFYLNGSEIWRTNMEPGAPAYSSFASGSIGNANYVSSPKLSGSGLLQGNNVLAVEVHQAIAGDPDMLFGTTLTAEISLVPEREESTLLPLGTSWKYDAAGSDLGSTWHNPGFNDASWSSGNAILFAGNAHVAGASTDAITGVTATASSELITNFNRRAIFAADGSGLSGNTHSFTPDGTMWLNNGTFAVPNDLAPSITFDLGAVYPLSHMDVWNYNEVPPFLDRGIANGTIQVAGADQVFTTLIANQSFNKAPGTANVDFHQQVGLGGVSARYIKFTNLTHFPAGDNNFVGLSEVRFYKVSPPNGTQVPLGANTYYFRKEFTFGDDSARTQLFIDTLIDDGAVFYLNGHEVYRSNMPQGDIAYATRAGAPIADASRSGRIQIPTQHLLAGANLLAVEVHQAIAADPDMVFATELIASVTPLPAASFETALVLNEVGAGSSPEFFVELTNTSDAPVELGGFIVANSGGGQYAMPAQTLAPGGYRAVTTAELGFLPTIADRLFLYAPGAGRVADAIDIKTTLGGRSTLHGNRWLYPSAPTPGGVNSFAFYDQIVINEIMYHHYPTGFGATFAESTEEWIELYNRSATTIDLTGWKLSEAVDYALPAGTTIAPGSYLVIAANAATLSAKYPNITILGNFNGTLANGGETVVLVDQNKNIADEVRYYDGGRWDDATDGGGGSLELRDPNADNSVAESWAASEEGSKAAWQTYTYRGTAASSAVGPDGTWNEFILGLLDEGEVLLDDISVIERPDTAPLQLIQNGSFTSGTADKWRIIGNQHGEVITDPNNPTNKVLRLVATGRTEHMHNHAETTLAGNHAVVNGLIYEISFRAKWISGSNQVNTRLYFNRLPKTTLVEVPAAHGTPGAQNSRYTPNAGPTYSEFRHAPAVPAPFEPVTVSVRAADPNGVSSVSLYYSVAGGAWNTVPMSTQADGLLSATIPGKTAGTIVQFYVSGQDALGAVSTYPAAGANSRALYKVDDGLAATNGLHNFRIIMTTADADFMHADINQMSNDMLGATIVYDEREVFYDAGVRLSGSERARPYQPRLSFNVGFNADQLFRGVHKSLNIDRSESTGFGQREMLIHHVQGQADEGIPSAYNDLIQVLAPRLEHTGTAEMEMARFTDVYLDSQYKNGSDGMLFEYELIYYPTTTTGGPEGRKLPQPDGATGPAIGNLGNDPENYRWTYLLKDNSARGDYSQFIAFAKAMSTSGATFLSQIGNFIDVDQWLQSFALATMAGAGDNYGGDGSGHNAQFYVRPADGKVLYFPHDLDAFFSATRPIVGNGDLAKLLGSPAWAHQYYGRLHNLASTTFGPAYMAHWTANFGSLLPGQDFPGHQAFIAQRAAYVLGQLQATVPQSQFQITTNGGNNFSVATPSVTLAGDAWINVKQIFVAGRPLPLNLTWIDADSWQATVPLLTGANTLVLQGYDFDGNLIATATDSITVTTSAVVPLVDSLRITEVMYHPADPPAGSPYSSSDFEFIEIKNIGSQLVSLGQATLSVGVTFTFPAMTLAPGAHVLVVKDAAAFASRYGNGFVIAGQFAGNLDNTTDEIKLSGAAGELIQDFTYSDAWVPLADGPGLSLVIVNPLAPVATWNVASSWRGSRDIGGSPGAVDGNLTVTSERVFYNNSIYDGYNPLANAADDAAIADDKLPLLPTGTATFLNYTNYSRGLNGLMVDIRNLTVPLSVEDFTFRVGNDNSPQLWNAAPLPLAVDLRPSTAGGSGRVTIIWADDAIRNQWLQVIVAANTRTGLATPETFYFGNAVGETGNSGASAIVDANDEVAARNNPRTFINPALISSPHDFDRDGFVNAADQILARSNATSFASALQLIQPLGLALTAQSNPSAMQTVLWQDSKLLQDSTLGATSARQEPTLLASQLTGPAPGSVAREAVLAQWPAPAATILYARNRRTIPVENSSETLSFDDLRSVGNSVKKESPHLHMRSGFRGRYVASVEAFHRTSN